MSWEYLLRMLRIHKLPMPDAHPDPELVKAHKEVEQLHLQAEHVLDDYAKAEKQRLANGHR